MIIPEFLPFKPLPNAAIVAASLKEIPSHWSLTPLQGKKPFRKGWQSEAFIPHETIAELILKGEEAISKEGKPYRRFWSGFGLRLGEASRGLLAIDVDGSSALPILEAMLVGNVPQTVGWTSGKAGRQQLLFQVPDELRDALSGFTRAVITEWEGLKTVEGELLEFRYNRCQSALPPSFHPDTGSYKWLQSPDDVEVAPLPHRLCEIILKLAEGEGQKEQAKSQSRGDREKAIEEAAERRKALGIIGSSDLFDCFAQSVDRLSPEEIFNWSGHDFKRKGGEWFGCCPQHQSASGESFTVKPEKGDWYCYGCGVGGGIGEYRHFINGGSGTPKGKDFFRITKELAEQARVELPKAEVKKEPEADAAPTTQPTPSVILPSKDGKPRLGFKCYKNDERPEFEETIRQAQRKLRQLSFNADIEINERYLPDELISRLPKSGLIGIKAPKGCGKSVTLNKIIALAKEQGIPVLSITPRISLGREQAVKWEITWIDEYGRTQNLGRNTATQIEKISEKIEKLETKLEVLNRPKQRNLFTDSIAEIELIKAEALAEIEGHKREIDNINISAFNTLALCWDSIWKVKDRNYNNGLVIIDEAELGLKHLITGSTCKRSRYKLIKTFTEIINGCLMMGGRVILSDADLSDLSINYIRESLPIPINPFIVKNEYIGEENTFFVDYRIGNRNCTIQEVIARLKDGQYIFTTADNKKEARALEKLIIKECEGFQRLFDDDNDVIKDAEKSTALIIRLDSGTAESDTGKNIIRKPNEAILKWQPRIVIATPTLGVGVSIDESTQRIVNSVGVPYFDVVVGLFFGVIEPSECRQQLVRVRANVPRIVCCVEGNHRIGGNASFFPEEINRHSMTYSHEALSALDIAKAIAGDDANDEQTMTAMMKLYEDCWDKEGKVWNNPSIKLYSALKARENYGLWNLANLLREEIEDEGHRIVVINGKSGDLIEVMAEIKEADRFAEAEAIKLAPVIEPERARELMKKPSRTSEENRSVVKALLQEELPELELDANFIDKAVLKDNRRWLNSQKLFWMCMNQEATADEDTGSWLRGFRGGVEGGGLFAPDIKSHSPKVKALRESGLFEWIDLENPKKIYEGASPEAKRFLSQALRSRDLIKVALGISVNTNSSPMKIAKLMMQKVGLSLRKVTKSKKDGRHIIDLELASDPDRIRVLTSLDLKWANRSNPVISGAEVGGLRQFVYNKNADVPPIISEKSQCVSDVAIGGESVQNDVLTPAEELTEYLTQFGDSFEMFYSLTEFSPANVVEAAIVAAPTQELRLRWTNFYEAIAAPRREAELAALADF